MKPGTPVLRSIRLLDQVRERIRYLHYSLSTEEAYLYWVRFFIRWHGSAAGMRHLREMGAAEVKAFLTMLATECMIYLPGDLFSVNPVTARRARPVRAQRARGVSGITP